MTLASDALRRSLCARICDERRTHDELRVIDDVLSGLEHGAETIGPLDLERDERDFGEEGAQECRDLLAYLAMQKVAEAHRRREWLAACDTPSAPDADGRFGSGAIDDGTRTNPPRTNGESRRAEKPSRTRTTALPVAARDTGACIQCRGAGCRYCWVFPMPVDDGASLPPNPVPPTVSSGAPPAASGARSFLDKEPNGARLEASRQGETRSGSDAEASLASWLEPQASAPSRAHADGETSTPGSDGGAHELREGVGSVPLDAADFDLQAGGLGLTPDEVMQRYPQAARVARVVRRSLGEGTLDVLAGLAELANKAGE